MPSGYTAVRPYNVARSNKAHLHTEMVLRINSIYGRGQRPLTPTCGVWERFCVSPVVDSRVGRLYYRVLLASVQATLPTFLTTYAVTLLVGCVPSGNAPMRYIWSA